MAEDTEHAETELQDGRGREHHSPEHASAKHERTPGGTSLSDSEPETGDGPEETGQSSGLPPHHKAWNWVKSHKKVSIPVAVVLLLAVLAAVPFTRYALAGTVLRKNFSVEVIDSQTKKPVTSATVTVEGKTATTNNKGVATIRANVGNASVTVSKKYYTSSKKGVLVPIGKQKQSAQVTLVATGRQVPVAITNKVSGQPVSNVTISTQGVEAKTDAEGEATVVVPANKTSVEATLKGNGYNNQKVTIKVTAGIDPANKFQVTPSGKLYFLSNKSGTIDVVKTNLDGTARETVLGGTGKEDKYNTVLLASQDWQYLALLSKRDGGDNAKLFLINTSNDAVTTMDEGDATFNLVGWSSHRFIYTVTRTSYPQSQANRQILKSFDASSGKLTSIDQTAAAKSTSGYGYYYETIGNVYINTDRIVYTKSVSANSDSSIKDHPGTLNTAQPDGSNRQTVKSWSGNFPEIVGYGNVTVNSRSYAPNEIYIGVFYDGTTGGNDDKLYEFEDNSLKPVSGKLASNLYDESDYPTYLFSPSDSKTFWSEPRDGKNTLFVGDSEGKNQKEVASLSEYQTYGWYTEKYLLVSKNGSELYILPVGGAAPLKITDYYKPNTSFTGYGKGYGGL
ncbi:MAG TPA: hypothetical protein VLF62_01790 [Candidatus Saccharimonadales bacterium]|nr:hypothetical protein [Candidatus Saccharimonadales bacterium]